MTNSEYQTQTKKKSVFEKLVTAHPAIQNVKERSEARLAAGMSLVAFFWTFIGLISITAMRGFDIPVLASVLPLVIAYLIAYAACRTPYYMQGIIFLVIAGSINTAVLLVLGVENIASTLFGAIPLVFIVGTTVFSTRGSAILVAANILIFALVPLFSIHVTPRDLFRDLLALLFLGVALIVAVSSRSRTENERLEEATQVNQKLQDLSNTLGEHIEDLNERTRKLEEYSSYLKGAAEVSRVAASHTDPEELSRQVVDLIRQHFDLYYVGLFLTDKKEEWAVLRAGTGKAGETMLADNHHLKIGEGMIGWAVKYGESRIALDVGEDAVRFENPALPETRSEGALPLRSRGRVLGALTVQSRQPAAFNEDIITVLQTMADQIAIAFDNAELLAKSETALEAERRAYGKLSQESWRALTQSGDIPAYGVTPKGKSLAFSEEENPKEMKAIREGQIIQKDGVTALLPIKSRGQILGGIRITKNSESGKWTKEQIQLAETLSEQLSVALESARLFDQAQRKAEREAIISEISAKVGASMRMDTILKTTVKELGKTLGNSEIIFHLTDPERETDNGNKTS